ncbi:N(6)-adenosine-methyltransferase subunit METTL3-like [Apostichopus japonicus]|uniref:N(6)-adenosine-methyltransferase subunit METTL3-like n=1 Tax=Stichopus japonicus TaxID=307972 RepID=UPI003AB8067A
MSSTGDIEAIKQRRENLRDKIKRRKQELQTLGVESSPNPASANTSSSAVSKTDKNQSDSPLSKETENKIFQQIATLELPAQISSLHSAINEVTDEEISLERAEKIVLKFEEDGYFRTDKFGKDATSNLTLISVDKQKISGLTGPSKTGQSSHSLKRKREDSPGRDENVPLAKAQMTSSKVKPKAEEDSVESLLLSTTFKEQESKEMGKELFDLLSVPTVKEQSLAEKFKSKEGSVREFCSRGTREECSKVKPSCDKLHFKRIIKDHTDESLGDCSFLNTCFHMDTCKYVHYEVENSTTPVEKIVASPAKTTERRDSKLTMLPAQWIQCDIRYLDKSVLGKYAVIMADPPWDIHMELPYGTMQDDEMRKLGIPSIQDDGFLFLWVTGRAMELGRECLRLWGYKQVEELIWVKTNQLQRLIRTGRTGHWLNHGKEHCLVGIKGNPEGYNKGLDCDVIVAEVRQTSHKPDEIYGLIERLSPGTRKIEFFGRMHNVQPNWVTLGNQLDGVHLVEPELIKKFQEKYPDMNAMKPPTSLGPS